MQLNECQQSLAMGLVFWAYPAWRRGFTNMDFEPHEQSLEFGNHFCRCARCLGFDFRKYIRPFREELSESFLGGLVFSELSPRWNCCRASWHADTLALARLQERRHKPVNTRLEQLMCRYEAVVFGQFSDVSGQRVR